MPTGPADNTYTTLSALLASDPTRLSARLVGDPVEADGDFNYRDGAWTRQSSAGITFTAPGIGATTRPAAAKLGDVISVKDYGAIGDGQPHPLSERFATLAAAQAVYPFATSLKEQLDWAGIQAALNYAKGDGYKRRCVRMPDGYYVIYGGVSGEPANSVKLPSWVTLEGDSRHGSVIYQQNILLNAPVFVNQDPVALVGTNLRCMTVLGGTHMIKINVGGSGAEQAAMVIEGISAGLQTFGQIEANMLQTNVIRDCDFANGMFGLKVTGICNANDLYTCRIASHSGPAIYAHGIVGRFLMFGGSIRGRRERHRKCDRH